MAADSRLVKDRANWEDDNEHRLKDGSAETSAHERVSASRHQGRRANLEAGWCGCPLYSRLALGRRFGYARGCSHTSGHDNHTGGGTQETARNRSAVYRRVGRARLVSIETRRERAPPTMRAKSRIVMFAGSGLCTASVSSLLSRAPLGVARETSPVPSQVSACASQFGQCTTSATATTWKKLGCVLRPRATGVIFVAETS